MRQAVITLSVVAVIMLIVGFFVSAGVDISVTPG
jgi:hypothetical protein